MEAAEASVPARREVPDLRDLLPGLEPERRVTDWGARSASRAALDRTVIEFLYRYWFRVDVEGIEHVPADGGALLVSNHAGALPPDAPMIAKAIREEHPRPRPVHLTVEHFFKGYPGFAMLVPKVGGVAAHPANVHRLLYDERQLVLVFPEGRKGSEKLYKDRYRLRRFGRGGFVEAAMRAGAPIVPSRWSGRRRRRRSSPSSALLQRLTGLLYFPLTPTFPHFGLARACSATSRPSSRSASSSRSPPTAGASARGATGARPDVAAGGARARSRRTLFEMLGKRAERVVRMTKLAADPRHRPVDLLGRPAGPGARARPGGRGDHRRRLRATRPVELERTEFVRVGNQHALHPPDRRGGRDRHGGRHAPGRRLDVTARPRAPTRTT